MQLNVRSIFLVSVSILFCFLLHAQKQNNIWYFGNGAGVDFNSTPPTPIQGSELYTEEGCAVMSDYNGDLLFYSNGVKVWDATHKIMDNGTNLSGGLSTTQSTVIVPFPNDKNKYYIFTADEKAGPRGLSYSIVNMTKRIGKGNVTVKNKFLYGPISEKLTVTQHLNGKDYWVIVHQWQTNTFASFLVTEKGVSHIPKLSYIGKIHTDYGSKNKGETIGQMKVSPNGKRLALAMCYLPNNPVELFDFNNTTGKITNAIEIPTSGYAYGIEFSPDNTKLYVSFLKGDVAVIQYDLDTPNVFESGYVLSKTTNTSIYGALQLAPNNKIYIAKTGKYLDVINNPNGRKKNCAYKIGGVNLGNQHCVYGLPSQVSITKRKTETSTTNSSVSIVKNANDQFNKGTLCSEFVELDAGHEGSVFLWSTGETSQKIKARVMGSYTVKISDPDNIQSQSVNFMVNKGEPNIKLGRDTTLFCVRKYKLDAKHKGYTYKWSTGEKTQTIEVTSSGNYAVTVTNGTCWDSDTVYVTFESTPPKFKALPSFSPSNSGFNSQFDYTVGDITEFYLEVKTPKGKTIWKTNNKKDVWKGRNKKGEKVEKGSYKWIVRYKGICTFGKTIEEEGTVRVY